LDDLPIIVEAISEATNASFEIKKIKPLSGGCINQCFQLEGKSGSNYFLKKNEASFLTYFEAEALALKELKSTLTVDVPEVIISGNAHDSSFLVLEFVNEGTPSSNAQRILGEQLAKMHMQEKPFFGWKLDNCIGATPQPNPKTENWVSFYLNSRLIHQFDLAEKKGQTFTGKTELTENLEALFIGYSPHPSLLHGDLWGGNSGYNQNGDPFIFDPASYYGDREADLAFTYMFGGFDQSFYQGYEAIYPLESGFSIRKILYNLYHELNHFNLFGGGYANSAQSSINHLIKNLP